MIFNALELNIQFQYGCWFFIQSTVWLLILLRLFRLSGASKRFLFRLRYDCFLSSVLIHLFFFRLKYVLLILFRHLSFFGYSMFYWSYSGFGTFIGLFSASVRFIDFISASVRLLIFFDLVTLIGFISALVQLLDFFRLRYVYLSFSGFTTYNGLNRWYAGLNTFLNNSGLSPPQLSVYVFLGNGIETV